MFYELWDFESGNMVGEYSSLSTALSVLRDAVGRDGEATLQGLALLEVDARGDSTLIAEAKALLALIHVRTSA